MASICYPRPSLSALVLVLGLATACRSEGDPPEIDADAGSEAADTTSVAAAPAAPSTDIWIADLMADEGGMWRLGDMRNVTDRSGYDNQPHFLDDGAMLFTRQEGEGTDIWRWDPESGEVSPVTRTDPESEYSPTPMPTGEGFSAVRVEADSTQRLWHFEADGEAVGALLPGVAPVGYHAWVSPDTVALFVLGEPATLQLASVATGEVQTLAQDIGRSLQAVPGRHAFSYVQRRPDESTVIRVYDVASGEVEDAGEGVEGADFHAWTPDGTLLQANGPRLYFWHDGMGHWMTAADLTDRGMTLTRLAVSADGRRLALVAEVAEVER
jgi:hypothetical protein